MRWIDKIEDFLFEDRMPKIVEQAVDDRAMGSNKVDAGPGKKVPGLLSSVRDFAFVVAIYSYFSGWVYVYAYFQFFGLSVGQSGIEFYSYLIYSYNVLAYVFSDRGFVFWLLIAVVAAMIVTRIVVRRKPRVKVSRFVMGAVLILLFPYLIYYAKKAGSATAQFNAYKRETPLPSIELHFKKDAFAPSTLNDSIETGLLFNVNDDGGLKLVSSTEAEVYVLLFTTDTANAPVIYRVKKENIVYAKTYFHPELDP